MSKYPLFSFYGEALWRQLQTMLPILNLDFAALCGIEGDFFGDERVQIRAFDSQKLLMELNFK